MITLMIRSNGKPMAQLIAPKSSNGKSPGIGGNQDTAIEKPI
jgi:hypothetical protein